MNRWNIGLMPPAHRGLRPGGDYWISIRRRITTARQDVWKKFPDEQGIALKPGIAGSKG